MNESFFIHQSMYSFVGIIKYAKLFKHYNPLYGNMRKSAKISQAKSRDSTDVGFRFKITTGTIFSKEVCLSSIFAVEICKLQCWHPETVQSMNCR